LTQGEVAERLGVARTTVTAMEKGDRRPSNAELVRLSEILDVSVHDLLRKHHVSGEISTRFRIGPQSKISKEQMHQAIERVKTLGSRYVELERINGIVRVPAPLESIETYRIQEGGPRFDPKIAGESAALAVRNALGLGDAPAVSLDERLEVAAGLRIFYDDALPSSIAGLFAWSEELGPCVILNRKLPHERRRWSLVHELGHFLRDREGGDILLTSELSDLLRRDDSELFADTFTKAFLMPAGSVSKQFADRYNANGGRFQVADILRMALFYEVSFQAMTLRLEELGLISKGKYDQLMLRDFQPEKARKALGLASIPDLPDKLPARMVRLALQAFENEEISEGDLADYLELDRVAARREVHKYRHHTLEEGKEIDLSQDVLQTS
jgi:Zn-dependent peptidase ImmA (M78 family)/DNA-binding XRE family transcriptional regulator